MDIKSSNSVSFGNQKAEYILNNVKLGIAKRIRSASQVSIADMSPVDKIEFVKKGITHDAEHADAHWDFMKAMKEIKLFKP